MTRQTTIIPHSQEPYVTRTFPSIEELDKLIQSAVVGQKNWNAKSLEDRIAIAIKFIVCQLQIAFHCFVDRIPG